MPALSVDTTDDTLSRTRAGRYAARHVLWDLDGSLKRLRACGRRKASSDRAVSVKVSTAADGTRSAGWGNVQSCGSVWACPVCSAKIAEHRRSEIAEALAAWEGTGGRIALATFTMSHRKGQRLKTLWDALAYAWSKMTSGRAWARDLEHVGGCRWIRVVEVTEGEQGWHVHIHALLLLSREATEATADYLEGAMYGRWRAALERKGLKTTRYAVDASTGERKGLGANVRLLTREYAADAMGKYFSKAVYSASLEVARGDLKDARFGNRTPFAILAGLVATGDADDLDAWLEWERASQGRRQIAWSKGLRAELLPDREELTDEEAAATELEGEVEVEVSPTLHAAVLEARADFRVLEAFEHSHAVGLAYLGLFQARADELARRPLLHGRPRG